MYITSTYEFTVHLALTLSQSDNLGEPVRSFVVLITKIRYVTKGVIYIVTVIPPLRSDRRYLRGGRSSPM